VRLPGLGEMALMRRIERRLAEVAAAVRPQVLHAHSPVLNAIPALRVGRKLGIPVVYEVRAFWEDAAVDHGTTTEGSLRYKLTRALETWALRRPTRLHHLRRPAQATSPGAASRPTRSPSSPTPSTSSASRWAASPTPRCSKLGLGGSHRASASSARSTPTKASTCCSTALPRCSSDARRARAAGRRRTAGSRAEGAGQALGLKDRVVFTGRVPHAEVQRYYDLVDVLAYPRHPMRLTELVTPLKPLEAMAQGRLLVASDVGGHRS
jgi:hypothetical protein